MLLASQETNQFSAPGNPYAVSRKAFLIIGVFIVQADLARGWVIAPSYGSPFLLFALLTTCAGLELLTDLVQKTHKRILMNDFSFMIGHVSRFGTGGQGIYMYFQAKTGLPRFTHRDRQEFRNRSKGIADHVLQIPDMF